MYTRAFISLLLALVLAIAGMGIVGRDVGRLLGARISMASAVHTLDQIAAAKTTDKIESIHLNHSVCTEMVEITTRHFGRKLGTRQLEPDKVIVHRFPVAVVPLIETQWPEAAALKKIEFSYVGIAMQ